MMPNITKRMMKNIGFVPNDRCWIRKL